MNEYVTMQVIHSDPRAGFFFFIIISAFMLFGIVVWIVDKLPEIKEAIRGIYKRFTYKEDNR